MANICDNKLYLSTENETTYNSLVENIENQFECIGKSERKEEGEYECEIDFESKWTFPHKIFEEITDAIGEDDSLYIRVLSYEFGCDYVGYNIYSDNEWADKING